MGFNFHLFLGPKLGVWGRNFLGFGREKKGERFYFPGKKFLNPKIFPGKPGEKKRGFPWGCQPGKKGFLGGAKKAQFIFHPKNFLGRKGRKGKKPGGEI